ncbi:suppressor of loss of ypt1 [Nowakowskiella sp. JEL0407]|nr:suppressor of loss of ypt1 [Nowakowskiella sp. JEL0407]
MYPSKVYIALIPLTFGVMLVCLNKVTFNLIGVTCTLISTVIFVAQNIFSKKLFVKAAQASIPTPISSSTKDVKLDKLNLLFYSAGMAFIMMFPIWLFSEGFVVLFGDNTDIPLVSYHHHQSAPIPNNNIPSNFVIGLFFANGLTHFMQNIFAFSILSIVSPVTYSIASLVKRIYVIVSSILYFHDSVSSTQGCGIVLTFIGLYMYNSAKLDTHAEEEKLLNKEDDRLKSPKNVSSTAKSTELRRASVASSVESSKNIGNGKEGWSNHNPDHIHTR